MQRKDTVLGRSTIEHAQTGLGSGPTRVEDRQGQTNGPKGVQIRVARKWS